MASPSKRRRPKPQRTKRQRSEFRSEFYREDDEEARRRLARARAAAARGRRQRMPLLVTVGSLGILLCIIAVGGSSAVIWLRKLGALFGVQWAGDF